MKLLALASLLLLCACKQDCETVCNQQLGCSTELDPPRAEEVGPVCHQVCSDGSYQPSDDCVTCLDSHGLCTPTDGGYEYRGCEARCPPNPPLP